MAGGDEKNTPATDFGQVLSFPSRCAHAVVMVVGAARSIQAVRGPPLVTPPHGGWKARTTLFLVMRFTPYTLQGGDGPSKEEERRAEKEREQSQKVCSPDRPITD